MTEQARPGFSRITWPTAGRWCLTSFIRSSKGPEAAPSEISPHLHWFRWPWQAETATKVSLRSNLKLRQGKASTLRPCHAKRIRPTEVWGPVHASPTRLSARSPAEQTHVPRLLEACCRWSCRMPGSSRTGAPGPSAERSEHRSDMKR